MQAVRLYLPSSGKNPTFMAILAPATASRTPRTPGAPAASSRVNSRPSLTGVALWASELEMKGTSARSGMPAPYEVSAESPSSRKSIRSLP